MELESAKKLLKKAILLQDQELIDMANQVMDSILANVPQEPVASVAQTSTSTTQKNDFIFTRAKDDDNHTNRGGIPVNEVKNRVNTFSDDGVESKDITTPDIKPTERRRPAFKMVQQTCQKCGQTKETHPTHKRDYYICDRCIPK